MGSAESDGRWDPCSIPAADIEATGLDATSMEKDWGGSDISTPDWSLCTYRGPAGEHTYYFEIMSSDVHSIEDSQRNSSYANGTNVSIGTRPAFRYESRVSDAIVDCNVAVKIEPGVAVFTVASMSRREIGADACALVENHLSDLEKFLPQAG